MFQALNNGSAVYLSSYDPPVVLPPDFDAAPVRGFFSPAPLGRTATPEAFDPRRATYTTSSQSYSLRAVASG
eukprot:12364549-Alexandrium_andersonii.AAC.1